MFCDVYLCRHPQILLLPLRQFQRNIGYLLGQRVPKAEILRMLHLRAGLLIEPLQNLHGEVLALRAAKRPLQVSPLGPSSILDHCQPPCLCTKSGRVCLCRMYNHLIVPPGCNAPLPQVASNLHLHHHK